MTGSEVWGATPAEVAGRYGCDELRPDAAHRWVRAVDVAAPPAVAFRWLCQLRAAPYSYDLVDNLGRRSPRTLTPGLDELARGQRVATAFRLHAFVPGRELVLVLPPGPVARASGDMAVSYLALPGTDDGSSRLVAVLCLRPLPRPVAAALCLGDLVMMRRQLRTLARLAAGG